MWFISIVTGLVGAFITGLFATVSPHVPIDLKQYDVLFVVLLHILLIISGFILIFFRRKWYFRVLIMLLPVAAGISLYFYYEKVVIYGINAIDGPKIVVFYPEEFLDARLKSEWRRSLREIPGSISVENVEVDVLKWPSQFSGEIEKTVIGKLVNNRPDIVGYISISEEPDGILLELNLPAMRGYQEFGISWVTADYTDDINKKELKLSAGFDAFEFNVSIKLETDGPHLGYPQGGLSAGAGSREEPIGLSSISALRNLPVADTLRVPVGSLTRGTYFASQMVTVAYFKLSGYEERYCDILEKFTSFDKLRPEYDLLKELDPSTAAACLFKEGPELIERIVSGLPSEEREEVVSGVLLFIMNTNTQDSKYADTSLFSSDTLNSVIELRETCAFRKEDSSLLEQKTNCLIGMMINNKALRESNPVLWRSMSYKLDLFGTKLMSLFYFSKGKVLDRFIVQWSNIIKEIGIENEPCTVPWEEFLISQASVSDEKALSFIDMLDSLAGRMLAISREIECKEILIYGWDAAEFIQDTELRRAFFQDFLLLYGVIENNGKLVELIDKIKIVVAYFVSKDSSIWPYFDKSNDVDPGETLKQAADFLVGKIEKATNRKVAKELQVTFDRLLAEFESKQIYGFRLDALSEVFDDKTWLKSAMLQMAAPLQGLEDNLQDPIAMEIFRFARLSDIEEVQNGLSSMLGKGVVKPKVIKNPFHMIMLYQLLSENADNPEAINRLLDTIVSLYPKEQLTPHFMHFSLLQAHNEGKREKAISYAYKILNESIISQRSFYLFYIDNINATKVKAECTAVAENLPSWTGRMMVNDRQLLINHLLKNRYFRTIWEDISYDHPQYNYELSDEDNRDLFKTTLANYLLEYHNRKQAGEIPDNEIKFIDDALIQAIESNQAACG